MTLAAVAEDILEVGGQRRVAAAGDTTGDGGRRREEVDGDMDIVAEKAAAEAVVESTAVVDSRRVMSTGYEENQWKLTL